MAKRKLTHTLHTYKRIKRKKDVIFACNYCSHYLDEAFILGKPAACPLCGNEYRINLYAKRLKMPHCDSCTEKKVRKEDFVDSLMERLRVK